MRPGAIFKFIHSSRRQILGLAAIGLGMSQGMISHAQANDAQSAFIERAAVRAAHANCNILDESEGLALDMGYWQARGALLRGGYALSKVSAMQFEAEDYASTKPCDDPSTLAAADRIKNAFLAFSRTPFMEFQGSYRQWTATRTLTDVWGAHQEAENGIRLGLIFPQRAQDPLGLADPDQPREPTQFAVMTPIAKGARPPASARMIIRDPQKEPTPWLGGPFGYGGNGLSIPPHSLTARLYASQRLPVDAPPYADGNETPGVLFIFDESVQRAFEALDPREAVRIEFVPSDRDRESKPFTVIMEVGDFRAAGAFSAIPRNRPRPADTELASVESDH